MFSRIVIRYMQHVLARISSFEAPHKAVDRYVENN